MLKQVSSITYSYETKLHTISSSPSPSSSSSSPSSSSSSAAASAAARTWEAEHVICTVPLGVLKAGGITFEPVSLCVHSRLSVHVRPRVSQNGNS